MKTDNELIAEFMGEIVYRTEAEMRAVPIEELKPYYFTDQLSYHTSWDWLRPVWVTFRELKVSERNSSHHQQWVNSIGFSILYKSIEEAHLNLVNAIKWYNEIKT